MDIKEIVQGISSRDNRSIARAISLVEDSSPDANELLSGLEKESAQKAMVLGVTGAPGAGKSTLTDKLIRYCRELGYRVGVIAVDPSSPISGGAIHGDRIRMMDHALDQEVVVRSMATRGRLGGVCAAAGAATRILSAGGCDPVIIETVGVGQSEMDIIGIADVTALVSAPGLGDDIQALKAGLLEVADLMVVNKADLPGADLLALELKEVAREKGREVLMTVAAKGEGVDKLLETMQEVFARHQESGELLRRRQLAREREVLDWCQELLRPSLQEMARQEQPDQSGDPRSRAGKIVQRLLDNASLNSPGSGKQQ
ncbi:MAG: methylmalonyl Co-A mutase-associated GTPase MeaB [Desulfohalobiaceae bacterium]